MDLHQIQRLDGFRWVSMCPSVYICTTYFSPARPKQSAMLSAVIRYPLDRAGVNKTSVGGKSTRFWCFITVIQRRMLWQILMLRSILSASGFQILKTKEKRLGTCKLQGCPSYKIQVYFFSLIHVAPIFFYWLGLQLNDCKESWF